MTPSLLAQLSSNTLRFSKSDLKLVDVIKADPNSVIHMSIANLATRAKVSEPTVNRLCHKLGCQGYPDFKLRLAQELSSAAHLFVDNIGAQEDSTVVINKILQSIHASIESLATGLDPTALDAAASAICECRSINFFGMGASSSVALDAQHKFFRFGIPSIAHTDYINQRMISSMLQPQDVAIFISYTGRTKAMLENAQFAQGNGATIIGITSEKSPLAQHCSIILNAQTAEDTDLFTPMSSRIAHLAVIDMLATKVALTLGAEVEENIKSIKFNLASTRVD
ncbi:MAG: transcriptional regulator HexR [Arenicella sp.]|jgi:RpiR family carbohydrate utilization transcriptional regulator|nr:transcriptional regulator HexR [bacterium]MDG1905314.1 transcriptional regulator HexR [Arenicella sp.]HAU68147.1 transcriptional regulator HexR [Gammaproteobacteria bacterium]